MSYSHLSASERFKLYQYRTTDKLTMTEIIAKMKRSKSTISQELRRNSVQETVYTQTTMQTRREASKQRFMTISATRIEQVKQQLAFSHRPEKISGRLEYEGLEYISHEII